MEASTAGRVQPERHVHFANASVGYKSVPSSIPKNIQAPPPALQHINPLRATRFAGPYLPHFPPAFKLDDDEFQKFGGLNCSYFSHRSGQVPTLRELKEHARALTKLIRLIDVQDLFSDEHPFDWLVNLDEIYQNDNDNHTAALNSLQNTIASYTDADGLTRIKEGCSRQENRPFYWSMASHANEILEDLDRRNADSGGLLGLLPPEGSKERETAAQSLLGQYLIYTTELVKRVGQLESELEHCRAILSGEALVPAQLHRDHPHDKEGRPIAFPQDRFILGDIKPELWALLDNLLSQNELAHEHKRQRRDYWGRPIPESALKPHEKALRPFEELKPIAKVPLECMFYRVQNSPTIFIVPAKNNHPNLRHSQSLLNYRPQVIVHSVARSPDRGGRCEPPGLDTPRKPRPQPDPQLAHLERLNQDLLDEVQELAAKQKSDKISVDEYLERLDELGEPIRKIADSVREQDLENIMALLPEIEGNTNEMLEMLKQVLYGQVSERQEDENRVLEHAKRVLAAQEAFVRDLKDGSQVGESREEQEGEKTGKQKRPQTRPSSAFTNPARPLRQETPAPAPQIPTMSGALAAGEIPHVERSPSPDIINIPPSLADIPPGSIPAGLPWRENASPGSSPTPEIGSIEESYVGLQIGSSGLPSPGSSAGEIEGDPRVGKRKGGGIGGGMWGERIRANAVAGGGRVEVEVGGDGGSGKRRRVASVLDGEGEDAAVLEDAPEDEEEDEEPGQDQGEEGDAEDVVMGEGGGDWSDLYDE